MVDNGKNFLSKEIHKIFQVKKKKKKKIFFL